MKRKVRMLKLNKPLEYKSGSRTPGVPRTQKATIKLDKSESDPDYYFFWIKGKYTLNDLILDREYTIIKNQTVYTVDMVVESKTPFFKVAGTIEVLRWTRRTELVKGIRNKLKLFIKGEQKK